MKKLIISFIFFMHVNCYAQLRMPSFAELHQDVRSDIAKDLKSELSLSQIDLALLIKEIILVADITRATPGMDRTYLAVIEDTLFGDVKARFDLAIVYGTQGSAAGMMANFINYSIK